MKRAILFLTLVLCFVGADRAYAQRTLRGMQGVEIKGGMADGFHTSAKRNTLGYYFGAAMATYSNNANKWVYGAEYLSKKYPYKAGAIPMAQFTGEGGYYYNFLTDRSKTFFFYLGASAMVGYETVNWGEKLLYDGATIRNKDRFLYGGAVTLELETYLTDRIILLINARERILWGTSSGHFHTQFGVGLKFIIN